MSTTMSARKLMTADEFMEFVHRPENEHRWFELDQGELIPLPPASKRHGVICANIAWELGHYVRQRGFGYITTNDAGILLEKDPDTVRGPDVALFEDAETYDDLDPGYGDTPPILAVEVLSPHDKPGRVADKLFDYLSSGVKVVWLLDPELKTFTIFRPNQPKKKLHEADTIDGELELPGFKAAVNEFFLLPKRSEPTPAS